MSLYYPDYENKTPVDLTTVKPGKEYILTPGPGMSPVKVKIRTVADNKITTWSNQYNNWDPYTIDITNSDEKKLYDIIDKSGGKKTRRNKRKTRKTKSRRKSNRHK